MSSPEENVMSPHRVIRRLGFRVAPFLGIALGFAWLVQLAQPPLFARADDVATILTRMREAAGSKGWKDSNPDYLIEGRSNWNESAGDYRLRFGPSGQFLQQIDAPLSGTASFNGKVSWMVNISGVPRMLELFDHDLRQLWVGLQTGHWLAHAAPGDVVLTTEGDRDSIVLDIKQGRLKGKLHVGRTSWLPTMFKRSGVAGTQTWT
jgi:hypothetical protein